MRRRFVLLGLICVFGASMMAFSGPAGAIIGGTPDTTHTYVGLEHNGVFACTGTLISPRVLVTAAHCFSDSTSVFGTDGEGHPRVEVIFDQQGVFTQPAPTGHLGTYYFDPGFGVGLLGGGLPGFDTHDVAIIVLDDSLPGLGHANLPPVGLDATLPTGTKVDISGYGVQHFGKPDPCDPNCKKQPDAFFTRFGATSNLLSVGKGKLGEFVKISGTTSQGKGGQCFGDSGGPILLSGTNTLMAETSFGTNGNCSGVGYDFRLDTAEAQTFIFTTLASLGLSL
jgi:secreted trypsin-like serine protease